MINVRKKIYEKEMLELISASSPPHCLWLKDVLKVTSTQATAGDVTKSLESLIGIDIVFFFYIE